jgi:hypothetical protein
MERVLLFCGQERDRVPYRSASSCQTDGLDGEAARDLLGRSAWAPSTRWAGGLRTSRPRAAGARFGRHLGEERGRLLLGSLDSYRIIARHHDRISFVLENSYPITQWKH